MEVTAREVDLARLKWAAQFIETPEHVEDFVQRLSALLIPATACVVERSDIAAVLALFDAMDTVGANYEQAWDDASASCVRLRDAMGDEDE